MKKLKIITLFISGMFIFACGSGDLKELEKESVSEDVIIETQKIQIDSEKNNNTAKVKSIDNIEFTELVHNYKTNENWTFEGEIPCIVDFYADWCAPCRILAPILDELAKEYAGKINIYKVDVDNELELSTFYGIKNIPTMIFCPKNGDPIKFVGLYSKEDYINFIETHLLNNL